MSGEKKTNWPRLRDLPVEEREAFDKWLLGQTCPFLEGVHREEQDGYYPWDYARWKARGPWQVDIL